MTVVNQKETRADLGEVAEAGIHLPEPTHALSHISPEEEHEHEHEHGFELVEVLRVIFVALAAAAFAVVELPWRLSRSSNTARAPRVSAI